MKPVTITIVIATFNSTKTLPLVLGSIKEQSFPQKNIEILLVDGGSKDDTKNLGKKFNCTIIDNPRTEPVYAKFLGFLHAKGKYIVYLDHDEVLENRESLQIKVDVFKNEPDIKAVISTGYKNPPGYPFINEYINEFGDPFSFFIYRLSKNADFFIKDMKSRYHVGKETTTYATFNFLNSKSLPIIELCAGGSMFDLTYIKEAFPEISKNPKLIPHIFYLLIKKNPNIAISKNDALVHYSSESIPGYKNKIRWRVKNNIHHAERMGEAGFTGRNRYQSGNIQVKKYLYLPYAYSIIFPFIDAILLSWSRQNINYFVHITLTLFTANLIVYHYFLKLVGYHPKLRSYDESKEIPTTSSI